MHFQRNLENWTSGNNDIDEFKSLNNSKSVTLEFTNEDMMKAVHNSAMQEKIGAGLQIKGQDELIDKERFFSKPEI
uniref:Uncharacterized protein n=1 Tax=Rhizophagus irregularis (strain DAOM 181602 / DAOM 197198 / MUCL 43194) TaxID=747089 RepID=U9TIN9_RHIID